MSIFSDFVPQMPRELKQKWLDALRSGKYAQGQNRLRTNDDKYCCIGVLCDVMGKEWRSELTDDGQPFWADAEKVILKETVEAGLCASNDHATGYFLRKLADMNDSGSTFAAIAAYIENHVAVSAESSHDSAPGETR